MAALALLVVPARPASAQVSGSIAATSDVRLRGLSLNGGGAALTAALTYDDASGGYAGASATVGDTRRFGTALLHHNVYLGYSARLGSRWSWDAGVSHTQVFSKVFKPFSGDYTEIHAALSTERSSLRLWYSPGFIAPGLQTLYLDANHALLATERLRITAHAGYLVPVGGNGGGLLPKARFDWRLGAALVLRRAELQIAWTRSGADADFLRERRQSRDALIIGGSLFF